MKNKVFTLEWLKAAGIRAIKTVAQTALSFITVGAVLSDINWLVVGSTALVAGIYSLLTSITGLPEIKEKVDVEAGLQNTPPNSLDSVDDE